MPGESITELRAEVRRICRWLILIVLIAVVVIGLEAWIAHLDQRRMIAVNNSALWRKVNAAHDLAVDNAGKIDRIIANAGNERKTVSGMVGRQIERGSTITKLKNEIQMSKIELTNLKAEVREIRLRLGLNKSPTFDGGPRR